MHRVCWSKHSNITQILQNPSQYVQRKSTPFISLSWTPVCDVVRVFHSIYTAAQWKSTGIHHARHNIHIGEVYPFCFTIDRPISWLANFSHYAFFLAMGPASGVHLIDQFSEHEYDSWTNARKKPWNALNFWAVTSLILAMNTLK